MERSSQGRPTGRFTQHRRLDRLRDVLSRHPKGVSLYELAGALGVSVRTMRRYMVEIEREYDLEALPVKPGGPLLWRIRASEMARKVELRRTQAYALLAARRELSSVSPYRSLQELVTARLAIRSPECRRVSGRSPRTAWRGSRMRRRLADSRCVWC